MPLEPDSCYRALVSRDARFDGLFFVGVHSTGIYCRPICPARIPGRRGCSFFESASQAEAAGYRGCLRCRPELAPGRGVPASAVPSVDVVSRTVELAAARIDAGALDVGSLEALARELGVTSRHLRRSMQAELGVSPVSLAQSRRLATAKQLLHDTLLPLTEIALASGFGSVRRFNAAFRAAFGRAPSEVRAGLRARGHVRGQTMGVVRTSERESNEASRRAEVVSLRLDFRPPYDLGALLAFLRPRALPGVELVLDDAYLRTVRVGEHKGWIAVRAGDGRSVRAELSLSLLGALRPIVVRLRRMFDLDARPEVIAGHLGADPLLAPLFAGGGAGGRIPGAFDGFECAVRAVLGQQVSVAAATTLAGRLMEAFGETLDIGHPELTRLSPSPERLAEASEDEIAALGIIGSRARTIIALAKACSAPPGSPDALRLEPSAGVEETMARLVALPGIGPWTAHYVAMRALGWTDAFPDGDLILRRALGDVTPRQARERAEPWRPWRAYAALRLWEAASSTGARPASSQRAESRTDTGRRMKEREAAEGAEAHAPTGRSLKK